MAILINCGAGEQKSSRAGANCGTVRLDLSEVHQGSDGTASGEVTIDSNRVALRSDTVVFWHNGSAGTYHGVASTEEAKTVPASNLKQFRVGTTPDSEVRGYEATSGSGGGDVAALVLKVDKPLCIVTSGYRGRRGWSLCILTLLPGGVKVEHIDPVSYRARHAAPAEL